MSCWAQRIWETRILQTFGCIEKRRLMQSCWTYSRIGTHVSSSEVTLLHAPKCEQWLWNNKSGPKYIPICMLCSLESVFGRSCSDFCIDLYGQSMHALYLSVSLPLFVSASLSLSLYPSTSCKNNDEDFAPSLTPKISKAPTSPKPDLNF